MTEDQVLQALRQLRRDAPDVAHEVLWDSLTDAFPTEISGLHLCVYRLMLDFPELGAVDAMEIVAKIGLLLQRKEGEP
jgi:hypothetical protein